MSVMPRPGQQRSAGTRHAVACVVAALAMLVFCAMPASGVAQSHSVDLRLSGLDLSSDGTAGQAGGTFNTPSERDWEGLKRDTAYFLGYQFVIIGVLYIMPENISSWSEEEKEKYSFGKWKNNVSSPVKDEDDYFINYVLHPYWGAAYYVRARERGYPAWNAFGYSVLLSTLYEYGAEALFEPVSAQDLIVTPVAGSLLGHFVFQEVRGRIQRKPEPRSVGDRVLLVATDPLGAANALAEELLGGNAEASFSFDLAPRSGQSAGDYVGLRLALRW